MNTESKRGARSTGNLWFRWTAYCACGEVIGMAAAAGMALLTTFLFADSATWTAKLCILMMMVLAGVMEGTAIGWCQLQVLRCLFPRLTLRSWLIPTVALAAGGWLLGTAAALLYESPTTTEFASEPPLPIVLLFAALLGGLLGTALGAAQWTALRHHWKDAARWVRVNTLGWAAAMAVIFLGASMPQADSSAAIVILVGVATGALAGLVMGSVTGLPLRNISAQRHVTLT